MVPWFPNMNLMTFWDTFLQACSFTKSMHDCTFTNPGMVARNFYNTEKTYFIMEFKFF